MRLSNTMREAFVRAAMQDVPAADYIEKARVLVTKKEQAMPKKAGLLYVDPYRLDYKSATFGNWGNRHSFGVRGLTNEEIQVIESDEAIKDLITQHKEQKERLDALKTKLIGAINACTTRKQAAEALPEFEKYLPADEPKALRSLPALANVAADFVKAGWPKGQKTATRKTA